MAYAVYHGGYSRRRTAATTTDKLVLGTMALICVLCFARFVTSPDAVVAHGDHEAAEMAMKMGYNVTYAPPTNR